MKRRIKKDIVLILLGVAIVAIPFLLRMKEQERSNRYMKAFEEEQNEEKQNKKDHKKKDSLLLQEGVIGIIEIPSLDIKYPVFEGAGSVQLNEGIGHMTNTTELCGKGNCVLAGHNGSRRGVYHVIDTLSADLIHSGNLGIGHIIIDHIFINCFLMLRQKLSIKII